MNVAEPIRSSASICRENGWRVGDVLEGDEDFGPERIQVTAIGAERVLAITVEVPGTVTITGREGSWDLSHRTWRKIEPPRRKGPALLCSKCHKPIRQRQHMVVTSFARHVGIEDGRAVSEPWLSVVVHMREECMGGLTPEVIREARKAALLATTKSPSEPVREDA